MATIIEHDIQQDSSISSALVTIFAFIAILFVIGMGLYALQMYPFNVFATSIPSVNVNVTSSLPGTNP